MQLVVRGATARTGRLVVEQALGRGHEVVAYVRRQVARGASTVGG
jgi:putative NADH-flavin reductase